MNLHEQIRQRKIKKIRKLIDTKMERMNSSYVLVSPGVNGWPQIPYDLVHELSRGNSIAYPLAVKFKDQHIVDFVIVGEDPRDVWKVWTSIITQAYLKQDEMNNYRRTVFNHICSITSDFKEKLETITKEPLPFYPIPNILSLVKER